MIPLMVVRLDELRERPSNVAFPESLRRGAGGVGIEPPRRISQIPGAHDVVALEDRASLVARQLHGDALGHAGPHEVAHRRPSKVVWDPAWAAGIDAGLAPRLVEPTLCDPLAGLLADRVAEDIPGDRALLALASAAPPP